ncbi:nitrate/nitrite transporter NarK [Roseibium hamelinense]|uniref:Nitrate/nitrite transporter NarK n=1 Tax=Roseibium hamelinense TaxID=150831 RepID=A0A562T0W9_9HYPH|nr:MFS transporter [Roseibium hamelinense]MTI44618.1 MFS transporter [Roseibium hamelinense]TWI87245.1 nitrate/nitrite transporter NarK [Roseibium hamelinense]
MSAATHKNGSWLIVVLLWGAGICSGIQFAKIAIALQPLAVSLSVSETAVSALMAAAGLFGLIFGVSGASVCRFMGYRNSLFAALAVAAVIAFLQALMPAYPVFYGLRLLEGITNLVIVVAAPTLISLYAPKNTLPFAMALWGSFYGVAFAVTGYWGPDFIFRSGVSAFLAAQGGLLLLVGLSLALTRLENTGQRSVSATKVSMFLQEQAATTAKAYGSAATMLPGVLFFFHASLYLGLLICLPLFAPTDGSRAFLLVGMPLISIIGTLMAGPAAKRFPAGKTIVSGFLVIAALAGLLPVIGADAAAHGAYVIAALALMLASGLVQGSIFVLVPNLTRSADQEALAFGVIAQLGALGSMAGPVLSTFVSELSGAQGFAVLSSSAALIGFVIARVFLRRASSGNGDLVRAE